MIKYIRIRKQFFAYALLFLTFCPPALSESPYSWYVFNIPPFGSESKGGIGYELVNAYNQAGLNSRIIVANPARWRIDMIDPNNTTFCTSGSWKLPNTTHRVYSDSILNTVDCMNYAVGKANAGESVSSDYKWNESSYIIPAFNSSATGVQPCQNSDIWPSCIPHLNPSTGAPGPVPGTDESAFRRRHRGGPGLTDY